MTEITFSTFLPISKQDKNNLITNFMPKNFLKCVKWNIENCILTNSKIKMLFKKHISEKKLPHSIYIILYI